MSKSSEHLDRLTRTFLMDQTYCDALLASANAEVVAELLISHQWVNEALPACYNGLAAAVAKHFESRSENATFWNYVLLDGINRDLRLVPYLVLRGVASEASVALRRALEYIGVLTHIWARPETVDALRDTDSKEYSEAFRREVDNRKAKVLRDSKTTKRFAAMKMGSAASIIYETLSATDVHGGTSARFVLYAAQPTDLVCSFTMRPDPNSEQTTRHIRFLVDGHRVICFEVINLCAQHAEPSEELASAAQSLKMLASVAGERSPELDGQVARLLNQLGVSRR